jgi:hypothetical protein
MVKSVKIIAVVFIVSLFSSGCNSFLFQGSNNNTTVNPKYAEKKNYPANTDPWKNSDFRKRNKSRWDRSKRSGLFKSSKRDPYGRYSKRLNGNRKGLNHSTLRTDADPNPVNSWAFGFGVGPSNSLTDIGGADESRPFFLDMQLAHTRLNYSLFGRYKFTNHWTASGWFTMGNLSASDVNSKSRIKANRGFSFSNRLFELSLRPEYNFPYKIIRKKYTGYLTTFDYYLFSGLNLFYHNPNFTSSQPVSDEYTTGYKKVQLAIPFGAGCYFSFPNRMKLGFDLGFRKSFFDHLDGITRPGSKASDYYMFSTINLSYTFRVSTLFRKDDSFLKPKLNRKKEKRKNNQRESIFFR